MLKASARNYLHAYNRTKLCFSSIGQQHFDHFDPHMALPCTGRPLDQGQTIGQSVHQSSTLSIIERGMLLKILDVEWFPRRENQVHSIGDRREFKAEPAL